MATQHSRVNAVNSSRQKGNAPVEGNARTNTTGIKFEVGPEPAKMMETAKATIAGANPKEGTEKTERVKAKEKAKTAREVDPQTGRHPKTPEPHL